MDVGGKLAGIVGLVPGADDIPAVEDGPGDSDANAIAMESDRYSL